MGSNQINDSKKCFRNTCPSKRDTCLAQPQFVRVSKVTTHKIKNQRIRQYQLIITMSNEDIQNQCYLIILRFSVCFHGIVQLSNPLSLSLTQIVV